MDTRIFYLLNMARHRVYKHADQHTEQTLNISVTQLGALLLISANQGCLQKDLAHSLQLNNSALTGLAGRMEGKGLIERRTCAADGRATRLYLTALGQEKIDLARPQLDALNARLTAGFSTEEINVILTFLNHLANDIPVNGEPT
ncbi:MarR family winged helix-turn-helix transcriptional regulator [Halopseudomonas salegens]|uniref:DNA-binding transcriptional regulator, MarR family n=1 Tax=Halopseudomonas salegens TaxID=1434072 RepID=A0A1H2HLU8_9GAMM|nr:MarR family transcriptional regulator [Halopseudomonas salegens]SDU32709.1 DNA-binding transcriptional regulator, MarR family [Halopseudomonas salegens]